MIPHDPLLLDLFSFSHLRPDTSNFLFDGFNSYASKLWNNLPEYFREAGFIETFKQHLEIHLLSLLQIMNSLLFILM